MSKALASKVKHFRSSRGLTKKEFAEMAGITTTTLRLIEDNPRHAIQKRTILKIEKALESEFSPKKRSVILTQNRKKVEAVTRKPFETRLIKNAKAAKEALDVFLNTEIFVFELDEIPKNPIASSRVASMHLGFLIKELEKNV